MVNRQSGIAQQLESIIGKIDRNMELLGVENAPCYTVDGQYSKLRERFDHRFQWTLSFFTGMIVHAFRYTGDPKYLRYMNRLQNDYRKKVTVDALETMHDLGFLYSLSEVALYKTTGDRNAREIALLAATELAKRFNVNGRFIDAWSRMDGTGEDVSGLMIIDSMMNLPLLFWAWEETGHHFYKDVAEAHADTTIRCMIRDDHSVCHAYKFDRMSGESEGERNHCGYGVGSAWARGTAWALYGFAVAYRYTGKAAYLKEAEGIADFFIRQLPENGVPIWDFRLPETAPRWIDTSACAIAACGLLELSDTEACGDRARYGAQAAKMIETLSSPPYFAEEPEAENILHLAQCGELQAGAIWGDYFYMEALLRLERQAERFW
ncbi:glycoside hydrolase family 88 protein [Cohnella nanjingensis]|uniref:Glycoside hydrolase family 88 protein n=1 Tax=Cohnella nanjingensis TaxID=1387779 RepID=A0A7X0RWW4_9BACL|nr:glycoside hydrolase family 88 protein [Cohnella nanjingensis]MBB6673815.1 glycoside hydrolase family 88 protein [Cohnella nanjingensis]